MGQVITTSLGISVGLQTTLPHLFPNMNSVETGLVTMSVWFIYAGNKYFK